MTRLVKRGQALRSLIRVGNLSSLVATTGVTSGVRKGVPVSAAPPAPEPVKEKPGIFRKVLNTAQELGTLATDLPTYGKAYLANVVEGSTPLSKDGDEHNWREEANAEAQKLSKERQTSPDANDETLLGTRKDWRQTAQSLPFSAGSMAGALAGGSGCRGPRLRTFPRSRSGPLPSDQR